MMTRTTAEQAERLSRRRARMLPLLAILSAIGLYFRSMYEPLGVREAIHIIVSFGIAAAIIRFGMLEWRGLRDA